ncbi:MAG: tyrosine-type recombinase/integrase [Planctomycetota bacterium]
MKPQTLRKALSEYLSMRRALGYQLLRPGKSLQNFVRFAEAEGADVITTDLARRWAQLPGDVEPSTWATRLALVRRFARHCQMSMPGTEVPPEDLLPHRYRRKPPHIYDRQEISRLLAAARQLSSKVGLRPLTYETLLGLLACSGLRISEVLNLDDSDVNLDDGILTIRASKFGKSRYVPIHPSARQAVSRYRAQRDRRLPRAGSPALLVTDKGTRLSYSGVRWVFYSLLRAARLEPPDGKRRPRLIDMRRTFAVRTLLRWYRRGADVEACLPRLSTYLGHTHVTDTYWYLSAVPELLGCALRRLEILQGRCRS